MQFQHDCAVFEWESLEECDLTEYQLWAQRGSSQKFAALRIRLLRQLLTLRRRFNLHLNQFAQWAVKFDSGRRSSGQDPHRGNACRKMVCWRTEIQLALCK